jgi:hypothetical protein
VKPPPSPIATLRPQPKHLLFLLIASMMLVVLIRDSVLLDSQHPVWTHYEPFKWWLLPHGITATLALLLGPLQFSSRLRRRHSTGTGFPDVCMSPGLRSACRWGS